ncbi:hypothetical protein G5V58_12955 [Nocardioides anomalus]|uniref:Secreted protein n=1 Tax=Nocardioides anomalus TaxID=2712223 RepID=A0A6G6WEG6_9ACTN|nr:hypothetical protein [Nocardioides anomalus]QIG43547.1 hypothetical protein G5V58_12955 [Nocardioides anomalus]
MKRSLIAAVVVALATTPVVVSTAASAQAAEPCTPSIAMGKPFQDPGGFIVFPATYTTCETTRVTVKFRDRDVTPSGWAGSAGTGPAGSGTTYAGTCAPDGKAHRWVGYATLKTPTGTLIAQTPKVYFKSAPVVRNCALWSPPAT